VCFLSSFFPLFYNPLVVYTPYLKILRFSLRIFCSPFFPFGVVFMDDTTFSCASGWIPRDLFPPSPFSLLLLYPLSFRLPFHSPVERRQTPPPKQKILSSADKKAYKNTSWNGKAVCFDFFFPLPRQLKPYALRSPPLSLPLPAFHNPTGSSLPNHGFGSNSFCTHMPDHSVAASPFFFL